MTAPSRRAQNRIDRTQRILDVALKTFAQMGYGGTTMEAVAVAAGLSKPTLYQYFDSKDALFSAMMLGQRDQMLTVFDRPSPFGMVGELVGFAWAYADTVMAPEMLSLARLIIGEVQRFPEIGQAYQSSGPDKVLRGIMDYLIAQRTAGRLVFDDAELAAQDLWGLILSAPRTQALYMPNAQPSRAQIGRYIMNGLRVFLRAYSGHPAQDLAQLQALEGARTESIR
jgi:TetR/AcrR family transcriptional regulator, mexJK operon transcriptional repressor